MKRIVQPLAVLLLIVLLPACKSIDEKRDAQLLEARLSKYAQVIRWTHFEDAYGFLKLQPGEKIQLPDNIGNIRVTSYEVYIPPYKTDETTARQTVKITYVHKDRQVVKTLIDEQLWKYDKELENWFRSNPIPVFE